VTALLDRVSLRGEAARDVVAVWLTITAVLTYLDVPLRHSPLFAANIVLQASLGMLVFTWLLRGVAPSLLLLCGPGLILGGALAFAIFQVTGRGLVGVTVTTLTGAGAVVLLLRSDAPYEALDSRWWMLGQLIGLGVLATTSEFTELIPVAAILFALGYINGLRQGRFGWIRIPSVALAAVAVIALGFARKEYWWLITDDYLFFEVLSRHITESGPFADWGVGNFGRYHWLSYGWSGLLNTLSLEPPPLTTLTRVMPITYSLSTAASLTFIMNRLLRNKPTARTLLPIWVIIAITPLDWSGTSTAGVYAALTTLIATIISVRRDHAPRLGGLTLLSFGLVVVLLTKVSAVVSALIVLAVALNHIITRDIERSAIRRLAWLGGVGLIVTSTGVLLSTMSRFVGEFVLVSINPGLGQLSWFGKRFAAPALMLRQAWLWIAFILLSSNIAMKPTIRRLYPSWLVPVVGLGLSLGLATELSISANANGYEYFSRPLYFIASIGLMMALFIERGQGEHGSNVSLVKVTVVIIGGGFIWGPLQASGNFWDSLGTILVINPSLKLELLRFVTSDSRFLGSLIALVVWLFGYRKRHLTYAFLTSLTVLSMLNLSASAISDFRRGIEPSELLTLLGSPQHKTVGVWLNENSLRHDLVATNISISGGEETSDNITNWDLALWSQREFLILAPRQLGGSQSKKLEAMALSESFAISPSAATCRSLSQRGVRWYVVDLRLTTQRDWSICTSKAFTRENLVILKLD